jgi:hypothetical protein
VGHLKGYKTLTLQQPENPDIPVYVPNEDDDKAKDLSEDAKKLLWLWDIAVSL